MAPWALAALAVLTSQWAACGGGDTPPVTPQGNLAGLYFGTASGGRSFDLLVVDNGRFYGMLGNGSGGLTNVYFGAGPITPTTFNSTAAGNFPLAGGAMTPAALTSSGVAKASIAGAVAESLSGGITFSSTYSAAYEGTATLAAAEGSYTGDAASPEGIALTTLSVGPTGATSLPHRRASSDSNMKPNE